MPKGVYLHENSVLEALKRIKWSKMSFCSEIKFQNGSAESPVGYTKVYKMLFKTIRNPVCRPKVFLGENLVLDAFKRIKYSKISIFSEIWHQNGFGESPVKYSKI